MAWTSLTLDVPEAESDLLQGLLQELGCSGFEVRDRSLPMPGTRVPEAGKVILVAYFESEAAAKEAEAEVLAACPTARAQHEAVPDKDWSTEWRTLVRSVTVGRLWVGPPWERTTAPTDKVRLFIEPKMAFGTGDHPTTSLCLAAVDDFMAQHPGASVLDVGTGTGVLAFAAKLLGAGRVEGTDNDPVAVELAKECAEENTLTGIHLSTRTLAEVTGPFDLVLANILANTLIELAPQLASLTGKQLVLAGVLMHQGAEVKHAFVAQGLESTGDVIQGEWVRLNFRRP
jgi:ribosomal protein L11 methyltransferase